MPNPNLVTIARNISVSQHRRDSDTQARGEFQAHPYILQGEFLVEGEGEVLRPLSFPVTFIERPHLTFGGSLEENQQLIVGAFPTVSAVACNWVTELKSDQTYLYRGCDIAVVVTGARGDQKMWVNWTFTGMALANPVGNMSTVGGSV